MLEKLALTLDVRHGLDDRRNRAVEILMRAAEEIAGRRGLSVRHKMLLTQPSVAMDQPLARQIEEAIRRAGCEPHVMVSGAGHDAMILAEKVPAAMIFLRTPGGISHDPAESVRVEDVAKAISAGSHCSNSLLSSPAIAKENGPCITLARREALNNRVICCLRPTLSCALLCRE